MTKQLLRPSVRLSASDCQSESIDVAMIEPSIYPTHMSMWVCVSCVMQVACFMMADTQRQFIIH